MKKQLSQVEKFHEVYGCFKQDQPAPLSNEERNTRIMLMEEELGEVIEAMKNEPIENIAKELSDLVYVVFGTYVAYGFQDRAEEIFDEVHRSNMSKLDEKGQPIMREDGKILKGPNYFEADVKNILRSKK